MYEYKCPHQTDKVNHLYFTHELFRSNSFQFYNFKTVTTFLQNHLKKYFLEMTFQVRTLTWAWHHSAKKWNDLRGGGNKYMKSCRYYIFVAITQECRDLITAPTCRLTCKRSAGLFHTFSWSVRPTDGSCGQIVPDA